METREQDGGRQNGDHRRADQAELEGNTRYHPSRAGLPQQIDKQHSPEDKQAHQDHIVFAVEYPDLVRARGHLDLLRRPAREHRAPHYNLQHYQARQTGRGDVRASTRREPPRQPLVRHQAERPHHRQRVRQIGQRQKRHDESDTARLPIPNHGEHPQAQAHTQVEIEKAHVKDPAIGQHGNTRQQVPRRPAAHDGDEPEGPPNKHQDRDGNRDALRRFGAKQAKQAAQHEVEQNIRGLADDHQSLRSPGFD